MSSFRVIAIPSRAAEEVREKLQSPKYGHPAHIEVASGYGPCRHCLRTFRVGQEKRILFTWDAFDGVEDLPLPGPVFIHADACERYPEDSGFPPDMRSHRLTLNGYGERRRLLAQDYVKNGDVDEALERVLALPGVHYVHVRDTEAGCYDFRIEPVIAY
ncbi:MAG: DUF1203 domain-containing protein [Chlamydiota bacterium]